MSAATKRSYKHLKITKPIEAVWVSPVDDYETHLKETETRRRAFVESYIILVGPTGSGKSSFIEAIASGSTREPLGIAKDQLESVTQETRIYELNNLQNPYGSRIYLVDTPGFADPRSSELEVLDKIAHWRDHSQVAMSGRTRLLYFHPITDNRMPATRKQCLDMLKRCWGTRLSERATLVTTMWDRIPVQSQDAMEDRFKQLSTDHWGDWISEESPPVKFDNTFDSAMDILDTLCARRRQQKEFPEVSGLGMHGTTDNPIYESLLSRLSSLKMKQQSLLEELDHPSNQGQTKLISILTNHLAETEVLLEKFSAEMQGLLKRLGPPPEQQTSTAGEVANPTSSSVAVIPQEPSTTDSVGLPANRKSLSEFKLYLRGLVRQGT